MIPIENNYICTDNSRANFGKATITPNYNIRTTQPIPYQSKSKMVNPELELALNFVEKTNRNIFLTGKAGTGKTTFLHQIQNESMKRLIVVAPTGVAAINAKGVTIHSFFQMPFGPILPDSDTRQSGNQFQRKFNRSKIDIIRSLDLLIIDEISMVRADLLDGIDQVLRRYKNRNEVFGGVQVLMIGDLQQLAPVVKPQEWNLLKDHYENAFFFSAKSFQASNAIGIELKHIYRQADERFIGILNEIRNNQLTPQSAAIINDRYQPGFVPPSDAGYITLTTHNHRANTINQIELKKIDAKSYKFTADIEGTFNESAYPNHLQLELKKGAQVMFIKNDSASEKRYYNGKIGKIVSLDDFNIKVRCPGDTQDISVEPETWENNTFSIDKNTKEIKSKFVGSFTQIPLRLAWAITIHKSQGLTFEKAIIDAEASFAHGQTYVALSRCKSLEGIVLKTKITDSSIISDHQVNSFTKDVEDNQPDDKVLDDSQKMYQLSMTHELFDYYNFTYPLQRLTDIYYKNKTSIEGNLLDILQKMKEASIPHLLKVGHGFKNQLTELSATINTIEDDAAIQARLKKAIQYFLEYTTTHLKSTFDTLHFNTENKQVKKDLGTHLDRLRQLISIKIFCLKGLVDHFSVSQYLDLRAKAALERPKRSSSSSSTKSAAITATDHPALFQSLRDLRTDIAEEEDVEAYQIFPQRTLYELCKYFPNTNKLLKPIHGMGKVRIEKYGEEILAIINKYIKEKGLSTIPIPTKVSKPKKTPTKEVTFGLYKDGKTIAEIAKERGLVKTTIEGHLAFYVGTGDINITDLMPEDKYKELNNIMKDAKYESFTDLKHQIDDKFTYAEMRLVASKLGSKS